jgi:hypothetical protein
VESRAVLFLEVMVAIAIIGVLAFLVGLVVRHARRPLPAGGGRAEQGMQQPQWYEFILALLLVAAIAAIVLWVVSTGEPWVWGEKVRDWHSDTRSMVFAAVMVGLVVAGLLAAIIAAFARSARRQSPRPALETRTQAAAAVATPTGSGLRLLGLAGLALALLLLCWIALSRAQQHALMAQLIYPASLGVALVLVFDKATRAWSNKGGAETLREWLLCDALVFLLCLGFLNLRGVEKPDAYAGSFWDLLAIALFFGAFWALDRTAGRFRFLLAYAYFIVLPILLLIWRAVEGATGASIWPFLILAVIFFVLEAVILLSGSPERQTLPALKDALFVLIYAVFLILAAGSAAHA